MVKKSLTDKLRTGLYTGLAAGVLGLTGCGGGPGNPEPPAKSISQTAFLVNDIDIDYCAKLENVSSATRTVYRNGTEIEQKTITNPNYCETLEGLTKGNYKFDLTASNVTPHSIEREVPNYNPELDLSNLNLDMPPNSVLEIELTNPTDKNFEDNPVFYNSAESLEVNPILGSYSENTNTTLLTIESYGSDLGNYQIELKFGNIGSGEGSEILEGRILEFREKIAFWRNINGNEDIYTGDLVSGNLANIQRLTTESGQDLEPAWSPDGTQIAWATNRDGLISIYKMNNNGTNLGKVTPPINTDFLSPSWSSDGTEIAFAFIDRDLSSNGVAKININNGVLTKLVESPGTGTLPGGIDWFKDGRIFYHDHADGSSELFSMDPNGNSIVRITNTPYNEALPKVSPDGSTLVFVSDEFGGEFSGLEIMSMNPDGTNIKRITDTFQMEIDPTYSNDGTKLLYSRYLTSIDDWQMFLSNSDGSGEILLSSGLGRYAVFKPN